MRTAVGEAWSNHDGPSAPRPRPTQGGTKQRDPREPHAWRAEYHRRKQEDPQLPHRPCHQPHDQQHGHHQHPQQQPQQQHEPCARVPSDAAPLASISDLDPEVAGLRAALLGLPYTGGPGSEAVTASKLVEGSTPQPTQAPAPLRAHLSLSLDAESDAGGAADGCPPHGAGATSPVASAVGGGAGHGPESTLPGPPPPSLHSSPHSDGSSEDATEEKAASLRKAPPSAHTAHVEGGEDAARNAAHTALSRGGQTGVGGRGATTRPAVPHRNGPVAYVPSIPTAQPQAPAPSARLPPGLHGREQDDAGPPQHGSGAGEGDGVIVSPARVRALAVADLPRPHEQPIYHPQSMQEHATRQQLAREEKLRRERALRVSEKPWRHQTTKARPFRLAVDRRAKSRDADHGEGASHDPDRAHGPGERTETREQRSRREREARYKQQLQGRARHLSRRESAPRDRRPVLGVGRAALGTAPLHTRLRRGAAAASRRRPRDTERAAGEEADGAGVPSVSVPVSVPSAVAGAGGDGCGEGIQHGAAVLQVRPSAKVTPLPLSSSHCTLLFNSCAAAERPHSPRPRRRGRPRSGH